MSPYCLLFQLSRTYEDRGPGAIAQFIRVLTIKYGSKVSKRSFMKVLSSGVGRVQGINRLAKPSRTSKSRKPSSPEASLLGKEELPEPDRNAACAKARGGRGGGQKRPDWPHWSPAGVSSA